MPWAGFKSLTLGVASSVEDHYTMPLPLWKDFFNVGTHARLLLVSYLFKYITNILFHT